MWTSLRFGNSISDPANLNFGGLLYSVMIEPELLSKSQTGSFAKMDSCSIICNQFSGKWYDFPVENLGLGPNYQQMKEPTMLLQSDGAPVSYDGLDITN